MILHGYYRSSASFRVRIALNLKQTAFETISHHLRKREQSHPDYLRLNPQGLVPSLDTGAAMLTQSLAIIEYLDETIPIPPLLPATPAGRARVRALAQIICCDIHPIDNLRVLNYLRESYKIPEPDVRSWYNHWIALGFAAIETTLAASSGDAGFCFGDRPGLADICLVPQVVNSGNFGFDLTPYPNIKRIFDHCMTLPAFATAHPKLQPDAEHLHAEAPN